LRRCGCAAHGADSATGQRADTRTAAAAGYGANRGTGAGADCGTAERTLAGIVRVGAG